MAIPDLSCGKGKNSPTWPHLHDRTELRFANIAAVVISVLIISGAHFVVHRSTHGQHVIHILLAGAYLIPIVAAAISYGLRGAAATAFLVTVLYYFHIRWSWPNEPMENANQFGWIAVFWVLAIVSGTLVKAHEREKARRLQVERDAEREAVIEGIAGLSNALRARDEYTRMHSEHVSSLAVALGERYGLTAGRLDILRLAGIVHDIGKIGVRDDVLLKPDELNDEERAAIERHPSLAADILRPIRGAAEIAEIVLAHHECPDGSGYPRGLRNDQIPIEAHILRVADVYSSLIERRPYKAPLSAAQSITIMKELAGTKLHSRSMRELEKLIQSADAETDSPQTMRLPTVL